MPDLDRIDDALERLEWRDRPKGESAKLAQITRRTALSGSAAGIAAALLDACGEASGKSGTGSGRRVGSAASIFGVRGGYQFVFVNHLTTDAFFTPTMNGAADACALLDCSYQWTGSASNSVAQMVHAIGVAVSAGVDGIATSLIARHSFEQPIAMAAESGIPVVAYNADEPGTRRLAYVGQDLLHSGREMGHRIARLIPDGGAIMVFISTPGSGNVQPRLDGIRQALRGTRITVRSQATGVAASEQRVTVDSVIGSNMTSFQGYFAVDAGSTEALALAMQKYGLGTNGVVAGGVDLLPQTQQLLHGGVIDFTIDQQPYLQGFLPVLELFLHRASRGLTGATDADTGARLLTQATVTRQATTSSRYEGTASAPGVVAGP